jgi:hypothetical protein
VLTRGSGTVIGASPSAQNEGRTVCREKSLCAMNNIMIDDDEHIISIAAAINVLFL